MWEKNLEFDKKNKFLRKLSLKFWVCSGMWGVGGGEWDGAWVRGIGEVVGIFREISEKFSGHFAEISGQMWCDQKTGNQYFETAKQYFFDWSSRIEFCDHTEFIC